jgi:hypothetical protein
MKIISVIALIVFMGNAGCRSTAKSQAEEESTVKQDTPPGERLCDIPTTTVPYVKTYFIVARAINVASKVIIELEKKVVENQVAIDLMRNYTSCHGNAILLDDQQIINLFTEVDLSSASITNPLAETSARLDKNISICPIQPTPNPIIVSATSSAPTLGTFSITFKSDKFRCSNRTLNLPSCLSGKVDVYDYWDFNKANRSFVPETLTTLARNLIPGTPFAVEGKDIPFKYQNGILTVNPNVTPCQ